MCRSSRLTKRGDVKSSCSRAGLAVDAAASAREVRAGRVVPVSPRLRADDGAVRLRLVCKFPAPSTGPGILRRHGGPCVRQNRVVLAVVATVKSCEGASEPNRADCIIQIRGAREARRNGRLPGDHGISRPAIAQGRPSDRRHLYAAVRSHLRIIRAADRACLPAPGLPCALLDLRAERPSKARATSAARKRRRVCE